MKKNIPRLYIQNNLNIDQIFYLSKDHIHYLKTVLRSKIEDTLEIFNNTNYIFFAKIIYLSDKKIQIKIVKRVIRNTESPLFIHLGQVMSKNEKMDFIIQKSIEMGVNIITPLFSENCKIPKKIKNFYNKKKRWEKIAISACQQCNRNIIPKIEFPEEMLSWCQKKNNYDIKIILHPKSILTINQLPESIQSICIVIGSEGGFLEHEIKHVNKYGFTSIKLGPRILRTETAALASIAALQTKFGDFLI